ncbi:MAG: hypothetical protein APR63_09930 [Desulfuromonas sp. SDB]|nr:MAG: hypothetical protein APR63_09930 [Desulfuromonas sp. SDB]
MNRQKLNKFLKKYNSIPRKKLSQNFMINDSYAQKIVGLVPSAGIDSIVEIGPGFGSLTEHLVELNKNLTLVEKDPQICKFLMDRYQLQAKIINADFTKLNSDIFKSLKKYLIIGNVPYNVSKRIIRFMIDHHREINQAIITLQQEVAHRLTALPGTKDYGGLTVLLQNIADVKKKFDIPPAVFYPQPKVNSSVVVIDFFTKPRFVDPQKLIPLITICFKHRRKTLRNNLKCSFENSKLKSIEKYLDLRAEQLSLKDFKILAEKLF